MVYSQNGWSANDSSVITSYPLPGGTVPLRIGSAGHILAYVANRYHNEVEHLIWPGVWGYSPRDIIGSNVISNHASGTAIDLNAPKHPLATNPADNYSAGQIAAIHRILHDCGGVVRWGGDYVGRKDGMHFEINDGITQSHADNLWAILSHPATNPAPTSGAIVWGPIVNAAPGTRTIAIGSRGPNDVEFIQRWHGITVDGAFGFVTQAVVKKTQTRNGLTADGIVGPITWKTILGH